MKKRTRSSNSDRLKPALIPQSHGGALLSGGVHGHKGAGGRPPSAVREAMRVSFEERIPVLEQLVDDENVAPRDRIRAMEVLARYGIGTTVEVEAPPATPRRDGPSLNTPEGIDYWMEVLARMKRLNEPNPMPAGYIDSTIQDSDTPLDADYQVLNNAEE